MIPTYQLEKVIRDLGLDMDVSAAEVREYASERSVHLAEVALANEAGYVEALNAEATNITLFALGRAIDLADAKDAELRQTIMTILALAVRTMV